MEHKFKLYDTVYFYKDGGLFCGVVLRVYPNDLSYQIGHSKSLVSNMRERDLLSLEDYIEEARKREEENKDWFRRQNY